MNLVSSKGPNITQRPFKPSKNFVIPLRLSQYTPQNNTHPNLPQKPSFLSERRVKKEIINHLSTTPMSCQARAKLLKETAGFSANTLDLLYLPLPDATRLGPGFSANKTEKVVGTATPKQPVEEWKAAWNFSTGDELMIQWDTSTPKPALSFSLTNPTSESSVRLLKGRRMLYKVRRKVKEQQNDGGGEEEEDGGDGDGFITMIRYTDEDPAGRATALLNWKLLVIELLPEEDAVLALLLCVSILRSVSEMKKEDVGNLLIRRRLRETKIGLRDWGSTMLHPSSKSSTTSLPHLQPWYWNAETVMASNNVDHLTRQPTSSYLPVEGGDKLYKQGIIS